MNKVDTRLLALGFFFLAIVLRFMPHPPNFAPVAAMSLFAGCYLSGGTGIILALGAMAISDFVGHKMGIAGMHFYSSATMLTVYFAIALTACLGRTLRGRIRYVPLAAVSGTAIFFLLTNFACWLDPMMGYPRTLTGLGQCYWAAIPFARNSLLGDLFYSAILFGGYAICTQPVLAPARKERNPGSSEA